MGMRLAENISYYIFTVISITFIVDFGDGDKGPILQALLIGAAVQFTVIPAPSAPGPTASDAVRSTLVGAIGVGVWSFVFFGLVDSGRGAWSCSRSWSG